MPLKKIGGGKGDRTPDLVIANDALYQLSYAPTSTVNRLVTQKTTSLETPHLTRFYPFGCTCKHSNLSGRKAGVSNDCHFLSLPPSIEQDLLCTRKARGQTKMRLARNEGRISESCILQGGRASRPFGHQLSRRKTTLPTGKTPMPPGRTSSLATFADAPATNDWDPRFNLFPRAYDHVPTGSTVT